MVAQNTPAAEVDVSVDLVRRLLREQHPDLADRPIAVLANGWDNLMCRLGPDLVVRLPRRAVAARLVEHEQRWLPRLAPRLPLPVPAPVRVGRSADDFPWSWSVVPLLPGEIAARCAPDDASAAAGLLGRFLAALHVPAPSGFPVSPVRGVPLAARDEMTTARLAHVDDPIIRARAQRAWTAALEVAAWSGSPRCLHGDLHPANILVHEGRISAVIDFGDMTAGDPATDLSVAWTLLPPEQHGAFRVAYGGVDDDSWARARGWAVSLALAFLAHSADNPLMAGIGRRTLDAALA